MSVRESTPRLRCGSADVRSNCGRRINPCSSAEVQLAYLCQNVMSMSMSMSTPDPALDG